MLNFETVNDFCIDNSTDTSKQAHNVQFTGRGPQSQLKESDQFYVIQINMRFPWNSRALICQLFDRLDQLVHQSERSSKMLPIGKEVCVSRQVRKSFPITECGFDFRQFRNKMT